jgi:hypothetical protein
MPKVSTEETDSPKKRAPRKRAVRRTISTAELPVRRTRTTATTSDTVPLRKAPARIEYTEKKKTSPKTPLYVFGVLVLVCGGATWLGFSDKGQIDVNAKITERNQKLANEATANYNSSTGENVPQTIVVPVQNSSPSVPNAGFRGRGVGTNNPVNESPAVVEDVASSTEATSTESVLIEEVTPAATEADTSDNTEVNTENQTPELAP